MHGRKDDCIYTFAGIIGVASSKRNLLHLRRAARALDWMKTQSPDQRSAQLWNISSFRLRTSYERFCDFERRILAASQLSSSTWAMDLHFVILDWSVELSKVSLFALHHLP